MSGIEDNYFKGAICLSSAHDCLRYIIRAYCIKEIYLPFYTCPVVWQAVKQENCRIKFYHIDKNFMPACNFNKDDYIVYTNYFGICAKNVKLMAEKYPNLIVDNAHAFFMPKLGIASFNSFKKFFNVEKGAILFMDKPQKITNDDFEYSNEYLNLKNLDKEKQKRIELFNTIHNIFKDINELNLSLDSDDVPMVYPLLVRDIKKRKEFKLRGLELEQYWSPINSQTQESIFQKYLLPLPLKREYIKNCYT